MPDWVLWMIGAAGALQTLFAIAEFFLWEKRVARLAGLTGDLAVKTAPLGKNFAIYNALVAAGLFWSIKDGDGAEVLATYLAGFMLVAGIVAGPTVSYRITLAQGGAGLVLLIALWVSDALDRWLGGF